MCKVIGKEAPSENRIQPLDGRDFLSYLSKSQQLSEPDRYIFRIRDLLSQLANQHILTELGSGRDPIIGKSYYFIRELSEREKEGWLWLAPALGPEFLLDAYSDITLQLTGITKSGDVHAGTGISIRARWILTCAHVVNDMVLDERQRFGGTEYEVVRTIPHKKIDIALVEVYGKLPHLPGLAFRDPVVAETVYTLGYPRIPLSPRPALVMQRGEITNENIVTFSGDEVFLYSAIARPGNSGGPVIAANGHVVGIVMEELLEETYRSGMPFYAGVRTSEIIKAITELVPSIQLPMEAYE